MLRKPDDPQDPSNRRISLIVQYVNKKEGLQSEEASGPEKEPQKPLLQNTDHCPATKNQPIPLYSTTYNYCPRAVLTIL